MNERRQIEVGIYRTRQDAEIAQGALTAAGIESFVSADDAGGAYPFGFSGGGARLLVDEADAETAAEILTPQDG
jgi:putative signal transducing protein